MSNLVFETIRTVWGKFCCLSRLIYQLWPNFMEVKFETNRTNSTIGKEHKKTSPHKSAKKQAEIKKEGLSQSRDVYLISENIPPLSEQIQTLGLGNHNGMLSDFVSEVTLCRVRLQFRQDVPDSGQEHPAHSDDCFLVPTIGIVATNVKS